MRTHTTYISSPIQVYIQSFIHLYNKLHFFFTRFKFQEFGADDAEMIKIKFIPEIFNPATVRRAIELKKDIPYKEFKVTIYIFNLCMYVCIYVNNYFYTFSHKP